MMNRMTKLYFNALFILFPVLFLFSSLLWKIVIKSYNVFEVITDTLCIIAIYYFLMSCIFIFLSNRISEDNKNIWKRNITAGLPRRQSFCIRWKLFNISWIASHTNLILNVQNKNFTTQSAIVIKWYNQYKTKWRKFLRFIKKVGVEWRRKKVVRVFCW